MAEWHVGAIPADTVGDRNSAPLEEALRVKAVGFVRLLRASDFTVGLRETQDALRVAETFLCYDFEAYHAGLRSLFCLSQDEFTQFDDLFRRYWNPQDGSQRIAPPKKGQRRRKPQAGRGTLETLGSSQEPTESGEAHAISGASRLVALSRVDFSQVPPEWEAELLRLSARLWKRMRVRKPSRLQGGRFKPRPHYRRILRRSLATGGEPLELILAGRRPRRPKLVVLLDVSGSMETYSLFFLRFVHALQRRFRKVHTFLFSTQLDEVTEELAAQDAEQALYLLSRRRMGWSGGTRIGFCLRELVQDHGPRVLRSDTVLVILSDGLDVGEPESLASALYEARTRARRIVWLNPLLGIEGYEPIARGMRTALPLIDVFAPAHNLESLLASERHLVV